MNSVEDVINRLNKEFGRGTVVTMDERPMNVDAIPTGSLALDKALGVGGIPLNRVTEIFGPDGAGKSTLALHIAAEAQRKFPDRPVCYIDMENALDRDYASTIGVDTGKLLIVQTGVEPPDGTNGKKPEPITGTAALKILKELIGYTSLIVVDSVHGLVTQAELDANPGDNHVGILSRLMSQNLKSIVSRLGLSDTAVVFINQIREKIGVMFGNPETTTGGKALKFYASVRLEIRRKGFVGPKDNRIGQVCSVKAVKNKVAPPFRVAEISIIYGKGISWAADIVNLAVAADIIQKRGSYYYYNDENIAQGQRNAEAFIETHPDIAQEIRTLILEEK